jgi:hypothetical protein
MTILAGFSDSTLLQSKVNEKVLLVHPVTSLDDAIDLSNR